MESTTNSFITDFLLPLMLGVIGILGFIVAIIMIAYNLITEKGKLVWSFLVLGVSTILIIVAIIVTAVKFVKEANKHKIERSWEYDSDSDFHYDLLSEEQRNILDTKTFEECTTEERALIISTAVTTIFANDEEQEKYEPKIREFYIKYHQKFECSDGGKVYDNIRENMKDLY